MIPVPTSTSHLEALILEPSKLSTKRTEGSDIGVGLRCVTADAVETGCVVGFILDVARGVDTGVGEAVAVATAVWVGEALGPTRDTALDVGAGPDVTAAELVTLAVDVGAVTIRLTLSAMGASMKPPTHSPTPNTRETPLMASTVTAMIVPTRLRFGDDCTLFFVTAPQYAQ
jgi:hypothetical protein